MAMPRSHRGASRQRQVGICLLLAGLAALTAPGLARGATTFGADLTQVPANPTGVLSVTNVIAPGGGVDAGAPVSGVLVSVRVKTTGPAGMGVIRVLTQTSHPDAMTYGFLNTAPEIPVSFEANAASGVITQVLTRRPITAGQRLGWFTNDPSSTINTGYNDVTAECAYTGSHTVGTTQNYTTVSCNMNVYLLSGTIEADADGDGFGDETQDQCSTNASLQTACPPGNPASPINPAGHVRKRKCKKKPKSAAAARRKCRRGKK